MSVIISQGSSGPINQPSHHANTEKVSYLIYLRYSEVVVVVEIVVDTVGTADVVARNIYLETKFDLITNLLYIFIDIIT